MCGIVGYVGPKEAVSFLLAGMEKLEYRGYDSAGIAMLEKGEIRIEKSVGRLSFLEKIINQNKEKLTGTIGIGHTRWATHGRPSTINSHPHTDCDGNFVVVHNGIIENYQSLKEMLIERGHIFKSETDTEVVAHLLEELYDGDFLTAVQKTLRKLEGSYALVFLSKYQPDTIICSKKDNPLIIGLGDGENFVASDIPAIISHTRKTYILGDNETAVVTKDNVKVLDYRGVPVKKKIFEVEWDAQAAEKGGYEHFMLKEIYEQPKAIRDTMSGRIAKDNSKIVLEELNFSVEDINDIERIVIVACGTAYHAGMVGKYLLEKFARMPVEVEIASEFRYKDPIVNEKTLAIIISQSGETIDTLAAMKEAKKLGAKTLAITNVVSSSIAREADKVIYTWAGPEIAVASTKAYTTQLIVVTLLAIYFAQIKNTLSKEEIKELCQGLKFLPEQINDVLEEISPIKTFSKQYGFNENIFFIGRALDYAVALEGSLKLKEISYVHAEAYAAGELKHGTLALVVKEVPVIALATQEDVYDKMISNIKEVKAREAVVIGVAFQDDQEIEKHVDHVIRIPRANKFLTHVLSVVPLQLLAYFVAVTRGCDVDKPRNLAKSVTVE
ncbi:glutamine--fructose-6-phosphate transaminase (isomerizing) [Selenomonadales bacterium OttesenSCG-928-I06]|nr:glutamine--fructose-6-phosphate transaminase (isomerizing) [Selenomonadales bacterium OttesenSCG-928-I06]